MEDLRSLLACTTLQKLIQGKQSVMEVPYTATVDETLRIMSNYNVDCAFVALPLANNLKDSDYIVEDSAGWMAWPGGLINATTHESTQQGMREDSIALDEEAFQHRYSGIVKIFDILTYFAKLLSMTNDANSTTPFILKSPIHCCIERKAITLMSPRTSVLETMERMIDGLYTALVPHNIDGQPSKPTSYSIITQMDIVQLFKAEAEKFKPIWSQTVESLNVMQSEVRGVWRGSSLLDTIKCMHQASVSLVPIIELPSEEFIQSEQLLDAKGKAIVGTFSASDLKGCPWEPLRRWATEGVLAFLKRVAIITKVACSVDTLEADPDKLYKLDLLGSFLQFDHFSCYPNSTISEVIDIALQNNVHKVWVVEKDYILLGVVSFVDILRGVKKYIDT